MTKLIFVDTETTGLDLYQHKIWEVGAIVRDNDIDTEYHWFLHVNISDSDPIALDIGKFWDRHPQGKALSGKGPKAFATQIANTSVFAREFFQHSYGSHFVGAVPDFDSYRIAQILNAEGLIPKWHYHLICVENLAAGKLGLEPPWKSDYVYEKLGYTIKEEDRHTALGDARMARDVYDLVMKGDNGTVPSVSKRA